MRSLHRSNRRIVWLWVALLAVSVSAARTARAQVCPALVTADPSGFENAGNVMDVALRGSYLYTADAYGLGVWDVSNPASPVHVGHWVAPEPG